MSARTTMLPLVALLGASPVLAQGPKHAHRAGVDDHLAAPSLLATRRAGDIRLDGNLDEAAWKDAPAATEFTQMDPVEGAPAMERTEVRILFDEEAVYVGARMFDRGLVSSRLGRRDSSSADSDRFAVSFDTYHDHVLAFRFEVNPDGVKNDGLRGEGLDNSWDGVWDVATRVDSLGWTAEYRIPLSQLRFTTAHQQTWGLQFSRMTTRTKEHAVFAFTPKSDRGGVARYGHLLGLEGLSPGRRLEILPYLTMRSEHRRVARGNPFRDGSDQFGGVGLDAKYGLTSNLTLTATMNPDFGQVELDPAQINLSAYETYYQERRPFFVEGSNVFTFGDDGPELFYSRRVGATPQLGVPDAAYADLPEASTILGAAKLTGRTSNGWSLGALEAVTAREHAPFVTAAGEQGERVVSPLSNFFVGRARREFRQGGGMVGGIVTAVHRDLGSPELVRALRSSAYVGGVDFRHEWGARRWAVEGSVTGSRVAGDRAVMLAAQRSSARYFQRPDAGHVRLDSTATSLGGFSANLAVRRQAGLHWRGGVSLETTSPGYEINDLGFQSSVDRISTRGYLVYVQNQPGRVFRQWSLNPGVRRSWNYDGDALGTAVSLGGNGQLTSYWGGGFHLQHGLSALDDRFTRGGPLVRFPASNSANLNLYSDVRRPVTLGAHGNFWTDDIHSWRSSVSLNAGFKPASSWNVGIGPSLSRGFYNAQYVTRVADPTATSTFGARYVYAGLRQTTVGLGTRLNVTFSPDMTLELYAQPYFSSGDYRGLHELRAPRTFQFNHYGRDVGTLSRDARGTYSVDPDGAGPAARFRVSDRDFNYRSLRGNAVLRWEFRPGSTLFLVWQQQRADYLERGGDGQGVGGFDLARDSRDLMRTRPENVFLIKVNYWINP